MNDKLNLLTKKKKQLNSLKPLPKELAQSLDDWLKVELTYSSNAIEGNTLTRIETAEVIEKGISATIKGKPLKDQLEAINHAKALEYIKSLAKELHSHQYITEEKIKGIHKIILTGINDEWAGRYRPTEVFIRGSEFEPPSPHKVSYLMAKLVQWLEGQQETHTVRIAADAHFKFVSIHPFADGNGRTARLLMNLILMLNSYPMAIIRNEDRTEYLDALNTAQTKGDLTDFYTLIEDAVERSLDAYLNAAQGKPALSPLTKLDYSGRLLRISELAREANETVATIRYWTKEGLLQVKSLTQGGYQLYEPSMIERARQIRRLQNVDRRTIAEIKIEMGVPKNS